MSKQSMQDKLRLIADCIDSGKSVQYRLMGSKWMDKQILYDGIITLYVDSEYQVKPDKPRTGTISYGSHLDYTQIKAIELTTEVIQALEDAGIEI